MARKSDLTLTAVQREYILNLTQDALGSIRIHDWSSNDSRRISFKLWQGGNVSRLYVECDGEKSYIDAKNTNDLTLEFDTETTAKFVGKAIDAHIEYMTKFAPVDRHYDSFLG